MNTSASDNIDNKVTDKVSIKVTFETTPNPATLKFKFSKSILPQDLKDQTFDFTSVDKTDISPLAAKIFGFPWVSAVFIGSDFVSITKQDWVDWSVLQAPLAGLLQEHIQSPESVILERKMNQNSSDILESDSEIVKKIKTILSTEIKPVVALDGGDIAFHSYENHILSVEMKGACNGCPSSQATLKEGIEVRIKQLLPEVISVEAV